VALRVLLRMWEWQCLSLKLEWGTAEVVWARRRCARDRLTRDINARDRHHVPHRKPEHRPRGPYTASHRIRPFEDGLGDSSAACGTLVAAEAVSHAVLRPRRGGAVAVHTRDRTRRGGSTRGRGGCGCEHWGSEE
jgi:hypothetical protein